MILAVFFENRFGRRIASFGGLLGFRVEFEAPEQNFADLIGRAEIEGPSREFESFGFEAVDTVVEFFRHIVERSRIKPDTCPFHFGKYFYQRQLDVVEQRSHSEAFYFVGQRTGQPQNRVGFLTISGRRFGFVERNDRIPVAHVGGEQR